MQVFGHTGTRTLKELLAEAETPTKRGLSARTGGASAADDPFGGPPTPNGAAGEVHSGLLRYSSDANCLHQCNLSINAAHLCSNHCTASGYTQVHAGLPPFWSADMLLAGMFMHQGWVCWFPGGTGIARELQPLADAFATAASADAASRALVDSCSAVLQRVSCCCKIEQQPQLCAKSLSLRKFQRHLKVFHVLFRVCCCCNLHPAQTR